MKISLLFIISAFLMFSCQSTRHSGYYGSPRVKQTLIDENTFKITIYSQDSTYGYSEENPIMVGGGVDGGRGPRNQRRFLNALSGPNGERIEYSRMYACCPFDTKNSPFGGGMLDLYNVTYPGLEDGLQLYINFYDSDTLKVPVGLRLRYE